MHGREWTGRLVREQLIAAFRLMPGAPIYSPRIDVLRSAFLLEYPVAGADIIVVTSIVLGRTSKDRIRLLTVCRARAAGQSVRALCIESNWSRASVYRAVHRGSWRVAEALNRRHETTLQ